MWKRRRQIPPLFLKKHSLFSYYFFPSQMLNEINPRELRRVRLLFIKCLVSHSDFIIIYLQIMHLKVLFREGPAASEYAYACRHMIYEIFRELKKNSKWLGDLFMHIDVFFRGNSQIRYSKQIMQVKVLSQKSHLKFHEFFVICHQMLFL